MQRRSVNISTLIILFSILSVLIQFSAYYFLVSTIVVYVITAIISLLFTHIFLEQTLSYESCFNYSLLNIIMCTIVILLSYYGSTESLLTYHFNLILFIVLNWFIPLLYCIIRNLTDRSLKYSNFNVFYRNINVVFILFYIGLIIKLLFLYNKSFVQDYTDLDTINAIPFLTSATLIENYLNGYLTFGALIKYFVQGMTLFIPYGFYSILLLRYQSRILRLLALLVLPLFIELLQIVLVLGKGDIDDILLGLLGGFIGAILYHIVNRIYRIFTDDDFLYYRPHYSFSGNSLHF